jgi:hypothetical protein
MLFAIMHKQCYMKKHHCVAGVRVMRGIGNIQAAKLTVNGTSVLGGAY